MSLNLPTLPGSGVNCSAHPATAGRVLVSSPQKTSRKLRPVSGVPGPSCRWVQLVQYIAPGVLLVSPGNWWLLDCLQPGSTMPWHRGGGLAAYVRPAWGTQCSAGSARAPGPPREVTQGLNWCSWKVCNTPGCYRPETAQSAISDDEPSERDLSGVLEGVRPGATTDLSYLWSQRVLRVQQQPPQLPTVQEATPASRPQSHQLLSAVAGGETEPAACTGNTRPRGPDREKTTQTADCRAAHPPCTPSTASPIQTQQGLCWPRKRLRNTA